MMNSNHDKNTIEDDCQHHLERSYAALKNLNDLELLSFRGAIMSVIKPTLREKLITLNYHRAAINIELLLTIRDTKQFQAVSMLARTIFELAVEIKLINIHPDAAERIEVFKQIEMLRAAKRVMAYRKANPDPMIHWETQGRFILEKGALIEAEQARIWPDKKEVMHWTTKRLGERAKELGDPFDRIHEVHYPHMSWDAHAGVITVFNAKPDSFVASVGVAYTIAVESYMQILEVLVNEFKLYASDEKLKKKIEYAKTVAFAESQREADAVMRVLGLG